MIQVGIVGLGFMGMVHYLTYQKIAGVRVAAICELNERRLTGDWTDIKGNFGPAGQQVDLAGVQTFTNLDELLRTADLDLIDVTLPPACHAAASIAALESGRHVFCEKPLSLQVEACDRILAAAEAAKGRLYVGHVLPFFPEYAWALDIVRSGRFGGARGGTFHRVIADPTWVRRFWSPSEVGGPLFDLHVHDAHFIRMLFGMPDEVVARGRSREGLPEFWTTQFVYRDGDRAVAATSGVITQQGRPFAHGFEIHLERATIQFDFAVFGTEGRYLCPPTILTADGDVQVVELGSGDPMIAFEAELRHVLGCIEQDQESDSLNGELARDAIRLCTIQQESLQAAQATE